MNIGELFIRIRPDTEGFEKQIEKTVTQSMASVGATMAATGAKLTRSITLPVVGFGAAILKTAGDFEQSMLKVQAVADLTGEEFQKLRKQANDLGRSTKFSATEAADAMGYLAMAGFDVNQIYDSMPSVLQLAAAAQMDLATSADIVSNIIAGYGIEIKDLGKVNDALVMTVNATNTELIGLGEAFKYVGPVAKAAGFDFNEVSAALGLLGNAGIQGSMAGTTLRQAIAQLLSPTEAAAKIMKEAGFSAFDAAGNMLPLVDIIRNLETSALDTGEMMEVFGVRAGPGMMALVEQGSDALATLTGKLDEAGGIAQRVADIQMQGLKGSLDELKSSFEGFMIALADAGFLKLIQDNIDKLTNFVTKLAEVNPEVLKMAMIFATVAAAIGPVIWILGKMITTVVTVIRIVSVLKALFLLMAANPITLIIAGVIALIAALVIAYKKFEGFRNVVDAVARFIANVAVAAWQKIVDIFWVVIDVVKQVAAIVWDVLVAAWNTAVEAIGEAIEVLKDVFSSIEEFVGDVVETVADIFGEISEIIGDVMDAAEEPISSFVDWIKTNFTPPIAAAIEFFTALWDQFIAGIERVVTIVTTVFNAMVSVFKFNIDLAVSIVSTGIDMIVAVFTPIANFLMPIVEAVFGAIVDVIKVYFENLVAGIQVAFDLIVNIFNVAFAILKPIVDNALAIIKVAWDTAFAAISGVVSIVFNGIKGTIEMVLRVITGVFQTFTGLLTGNFSKTFEGLKNIVVAPFTFIKDQVTNITTVLVNTVKTLFDGLVAFFASVPNRIGGALGGIRDAMTGVFRAAINGIKTLWNNTLGRLSFSIPSWVPFVGGKSFSFPKFPEFANGGIINAPTLGWVGEAGPEAIIPLNRPDRALDLMRQTGLDSLAAGRNMGPAVNIQNAVFNNGTDANLVAQKVLAAERARSFTT